MSDQIYILRDYIGWGEWRKIEVKILRVIDKKRCLVLVEALSGEPFVSGGFFGPFSSPQKTVHTDALTKIKNIKKEQNND